MSEVNVLWSSPWLTLQKNLAIGLAGASAIGSASKASVQARPLAAASSWLVRARGRKVPVSPSTQ